MTYCVLQQCHSHVSRLQAMMTNNKRSRMLQAPGFVFILHQPPSMKKFRTFSSFQRPNAGMFADLVFNMFEYLSILCSGIFLQIGYHILIICWWSACFYIVCLFMWFLRDIFVAHVFNFKLFTFALAAQMPLRWSCFCCTCWFGFPNLHDLPSCIHMKIISFHWQIIGSIESHNNTGCNHSAYRLGTKNIIDMWVRRALHTANSNGQTASPMFSGRSQGPFVN